MTELKEIIPYHRPFPLSDRDLDNILIVIDDILESGQLTNGSFVQLLEERIKDLYGVDYVIATSNCTMGLKLCFQYHSFMDNVIMPNFTWISPYLMIDKREKKFVDINKKTWLAKITTEENNLNIIFPTHTFGSIIELEDDYHVIYDGAHAFGSKINKFGDATVLSLAPTKLVTSCEGGLVLTNQPYLADFVRFRRDKCARMSEIHAVIGLQTLGHLEEILQWKKKVYDYYKKYIPYPFQEIPYNSNYNTIGFLNVENLKIPKHITIKQYYEPIFQIDLLPNAFEVYQNIICLPSYYGCPYKEIVEDILELNGLL